MAETKNPRKSIAVRLRLELLESEDASDRPAVVAYAYSSGGRLLDSRPVDKEGNALLKFPAALEGMSVRVLVGPKLDEAQSGLAELLRRGAVERHLRADLDTQEYQIDFQIIPDVWFCWLRSACFVRGTLLKRVRSGGVDIDLPVCEATVEIYEVDAIRLVLPRIPDDVIERIREILLVPPKPPLPDPPPFRFPQPEPPVDDFLRVGQSIESLATLARPIESGSAQARLGERSLSPEYLHLLRSAPPAQLRRIFIDLEDLIRPILCRHFPWFVRMDRIATARTDECGHFRTFFFRGCHNTDAPDLYFKAKQVLFGFFSVTILEPLPVACHTHWDYECGTEVTLYTRHPLAHTCPPCPPVIAPDNWVLVMAIGNFPLSRIRGTGLSLQATTDSTNIGLTDGGAPWGGLLRPRIEFDNLLRDSLGVKYYQVSWRKGSAGDFHPMTGDVQRHYAHMTAGQLVLTPYPLGPQTVNGVPNLFEIPPALPPEGQWSLPDVIEGTTSAKFPSAELAPAVEHGKYQIKVDLFDINGAPVNIAAKGIRFVVPTSIDLSGTIETTDAAALGLVSGNSFIMTLHVDNSPCNDAVIDAPTLNGMPADDNCGVLRYPVSPPASVVMGWRASHPNGVAAEGFATYSFRLYRGVNQLVLPPVSPPPQRLPAGGRALIGAGAFSDTETVADLLGGCTVAGFSENLYVAAMAIDGWRRLHEYDRSAVRAFVLAPQGPQPSTTP